MDDRTRQLETLVQDRAAAELHGDATFLREVLADDFVGIGPHGFMLNKGQWLARYESGSLNYESFQWDEIQVRLYGDSAVVTGRETVKGEYEDYDIQDQFRATLVFVKQQRHWLLGGLHLSPIAGKP